MMWRKMIGLILSGTVRNTAIVVGGNGMAMVLAVGFTILAARALGPRDWGIVAAVGNLITILVALADLGLGAGLLRFVSRTLGEGDKEGARKIFKVVLLFRVLTSLAFIAVLVVLAHVITGWIFHSQEVYLVWFAAVGLAGFLLLDFQVTAVEAEQQWWKAAWFYTLSNGLRLALLLGLVALNQVNLFTVLAVFAISAFLAFWVSLFWKGVEVGWVKEWRGVLRRIVPFSGWMGVNKIVSSFNSRVDVLILVQMVGAYQTGIYAAASRLAMGVPIILGGLATVLAQRFASFSKDEEVGEFLKKALGLSALVSLGLVVGVVVAPWVIWLFGPEYQASLVVLQWMLVAFIPFTLATPAVNALIYGLAKPQIVTWVSVVQLPLILGLNFFFVPRMGVMAPVVVLGVVNVTLALVVYFYVIKYLKRRER